MKKFVLLIVLIVVGTLVAREVVSRVVHRPARPHYVKASDLPLATANEEELAAAPTVKTQVVTQEKIIPGTSGRFNPDGSVVYDKSPYGEDGDGPGSNKPPGSTGTEADWAANMAASRNHLGLDVAHLPEGLAFEVMWGEPQDSLNNGNGAVAVRVTNNSNPPHPIEGGTKFKFVLDKGLEPTNVIGEGGYRVPTVPANNDPIWSANVLLNEGYIVPRLMPGAGIQVDLYVRLTSSAPPPGNEQIHAQLYVKGPTDKKWNAYGRRAGWWY
jgi:hypothetical protein